MLKFGIIGAIGCSLAVLPSLLLQQVVAIGNENSGFIGYTETASGTFTAEDCGPSWTRFSTVLASTTYGSCANGTDKNPLMPIACQDNTVYRADGTSSASYYTCETGKQCVTRHIFPSAGATNYAVDMNCGTTSSETVYMTVPGGSVLIDENGNLITIAGGQYKPHYHSYTPPTETGTPSSPTLGAQGPETSSSPGPNQPTSSGSEPLSRKALIGAILAAVLGTLLIVAAVVACLWMRRKRRSQALVEKDDDSSQTRELGESKVYEMPGHNTAAEKPVEIEAFEMDMQRDRKR